MLRVQSDSRKATHNEHYYGASFFPVGPLSWAGPLWCYLCGIAASGGWRWTLASGLRLATGLLIVGPLLGTAWAATITLQRLTLPSSDAGSDCTASPRLLLPYALAGSPSERLSRALSRCAARGRAVWPILGTPLLHALSGAVFALILASQLSLQAAVLVLLGIAFALVAGGNKVPVVISSTLATLGPLWLAWQFGHAAFGALRLLPLLAGTCYAVTLQATIHLHRTNHHITTSLIVLLGTQMAAMSCLLLARQPIIAAATGMLITFQALLSPLVGLWQDASECPRTSDYVRAIQLPIMVSMLLAALAMGYQG